MGGGGGEEWRRGRPTVAIMSLVFIPCFVPKKTGREGGVEIVIFSVLS